MTAPTGTSTPGRGLLIWQSVLAGLQVIAGTSGLADLIPGKWVALFVILVAAIQVGTATFVHGLVTMPPATPVVMAQSGTPVEITAQVKPGTDVPEPSSTRVGFGDDEVHP